MKLANLIKKPQSLEDKVYAGSRKALSRFEQIKDHMILRHLEMWNDVWQMMSSAKQDRRYESADVYIDRLNDILDRYNHI